MQTEELRAQLLRFLATWNFQANQGLRWDDCRKGVSRQIASDSQGRLAPEWEMPREDMVRLKAIVWDLIIGRVLSPGWINSSDSGWPMLSLTDHGEKVIKGTHPVPYDPDGYLARLLKFTGGLSASVLRYLEESLSTFRTSNYLASAVMLGAASEMLFLGLCRAISEAIQDPQYAKSFDERTGFKKHMADRVKAVAEWLSHKQSALPPDWQNRDRLLIINKVADLIRDRRNEAGHPQGPPVARTHEEMYALICIFPDYCIKLCELTNWLRRNPSSIA